MRRKIVVVAAATVLGAAIGWVLGKGPMLHYKSEGVMSVEMSTAEYKRVAALVNDTNTVQQFAKRHPPAGLSEADVHELIRDVSKGEWNKPVPRISRADSKDLPDLLMQLEQEREQARDTAGTANGDRLRTPATVYLGVRLEGEGPTPDAAASTAKWLGAYFKDMAAREAVRDQVARWTAESHRYSDRSAERKLKYQFDIEEAQARATALKKLVSAYPDAVRRDSSQVVDVRRDNEKFMSPLAQLVGAESEIIDIRNKLKRLDREVEQQGFVKDLVADAKSSTAKAQSGVDSINSLSSVITAYSKKVKSDAESEKLSSMAADISQISARFLTQAEFVAEPSVPDRPEAPRPLTVTILGALVLGMLAAIVVWSRELVAALFGGGSRDRI
ncbi:MULTISPECIES: hypothetical protein [unclassified Cupriavidus]|uniref:hypothetical protein n=1 Tax=unclassified Cupriavidus TaxID=2640874 RepID=UPI001C0087A1|nr:MULTISPECIES: hypothetical protein [unclassified Cupriavidus]MCA3192840.1 hypothetical protein [Cupriavidus sp.]MCA3195041.1 hypothetical protein [Cupriavidus sp.]MCA3204011.1 hypothetical protein [Cupriavidus sp.]MCA3206174.1 hypothetical protein [Cupriavidus sp.]MCA3233341.1 hypothetical protein [Cupriavidus sp.]